MFSFFFFFPQKGFLAPCLVLFPQATLKFLWRFTYFCLPLPHSSLDSLFLIYSSHLGLLPVLLLAGWQVFQALIHTLTNDRCPWSFYHLDFPWHFCSFIEFWVILSLDILGPQSARSLCITVMCTRTRKLQEVNEEALLSGSDPCLSCPGQCLSDAQWLLWWCGTSKPHKTGA